MPLEDHRKPNGNYDGVGVMAEVTGLARDEIRAIAEQVKANGDKLRGCPWHEFEELFTAPPGRARYRCRCCGGEVDGSAYHWHEQGRRACPQPELPEVQGYVCVDGPLDGQTLIYRGAVFHVTRNGPAPAAAHDGLTMPPRHPAIETAAYHLYRDDAGRKFWKFGGWPT